MHATDLCTWRWVLKLGSICCPLTGAVDHTFAGSSVSSCESVCVRVRQWESMSFSAHHRAADAPAIVARRRSCGFCTEADRRRNSSAATGGAQEGGGVGKRSIDNTHAHAHARRHADTQTRRHADTQTRKHTNRHRQTQTHAQTHAHTCTKTQHDNGQTNHRTWAVVNTQCLRLYLSLPLPLRDQGGGGHAFGRSGCTERHR